LAQHRGYTESHCLNRCSPPFRTGVFSYKLDPPILIAPRDAVIVAYRFHTEAEGKAILPSETAQYTIRLSL